MSRTPQKYTFGDLRSALELPHIPTILDILANGTTEDTPYDFLESYISERLGYLPVSYWEDNAGIKWEHARSVDDNFARPITRLGSTERVRASIDNLDSLLEDVWVILRTAMLEQHWLPWANAQPSDQQPKLELLTHKLRKCLIDPLNRKAVLRQARSDANVERAAWSSASAAVSCICSLNRNEAFNFAITAILWDDPLRYELLYKEGTEDALNYRIDQKVLELANLTP